MTECSLLRTLWLESELFRTWAAKSFGRHGTFATMVRTQLHEHHIFGGKTRKDLPSNTITICAAVHDFCHAYTTEGRIACLYWKLTRPKNDAATTWAEWDESAGFSVAGWLDSVKDQPPERLFVVWASRMALLSTSHIPRQSTATGETTGAEPTSARKAKSFAEPSPE